MHDAGVVQDVEGRSGIGIGRQQFPRLLIGFERLLRVSQTAVDDGQVGQHLRFDAWLLLKRQRADFFV